MMIDNFGAVGGLLWREQALVEQQQIGLLVLLVEERLDRVTLRGRLTDGREKSRLSFPGAK